MSRARYTIVDVFTDRPFGGNPLAVFADGPRVPPELMQTIARELNLSETTYVLPPDDPQHDCRVRIFTPQAELPIAGHPTIGTAFVLAGRGGDENENGVREFVFEEGVGPVPVRVQFADGAPDMIWMQQPVPEFQEVPLPPDTFEQLLSLPTGAVSDTGLPVEVGSCGTPFLYVPVRDLEAIGRAVFRPDIAAQLPAHIHAGNVFFFTLDVAARDVTVHSRMFAPAFGIPEDPATGVASGPLGAYLVRHGVVPGEGTTAIISEQGIEMGRPSRVHIEIDHANGTITDVRVGGRCARVGEGALDLP